MKKTTHTSHTTYIPEGVESTESSSVCSFPISRDHITACVRDLCEKGLSFAFCTATDERVGGGQCTIWYVFSVPHSPVCIVPCVHLSEGESVPSITAQVHSALPFEQRLQTFFGITVDNIPDARTIVLHDTWPRDVFPLRKEFAWHTQVSEARETYSFQEVAGEGIYEIPVGPIHAGIIEPGHFRFSVAGEEIINLEPRLGYVHKGSEKLFETVKTDKEKVHLAEKISGDSSFAHSLALCQALELLSNSTVPPRALFLRTIFAELERLANHIGDIGAMQLDTGFSFGGAHGARLREQVMQQNEILTGSRFLRGVTAVGGVHKDIDPEASVALSKYLYTLGEDFTRCVDIAENNASLMNRLRDTGIVSHDTAVRLGLRGVSARASGIERDVRKDAPYAAYTVVPPSHIALAQEGDVYARFRVRVAEVYTSLDIITRALAMMPQGACITHSSHDSAYEKNTCAVSMVEGWRGEILYFVKTDKEGDITRITPCDPSIRNWYACPEAVLNNIVPDFPLINKSFNLSYSGNDM